ncbi:MAG: D-alanine--D-alanine ligase [Rhodospirillales bacterium]|nr:D-alanine--D-alanine ligase [Rhodospirillales bacterium]
MRIGLTYDALADWAGEALDAEQLAEFDAEETIAAIAGRLAARGHAVERIGRAQALLGRLHAGAHWDIVFNICEGLRGPGREALVPALLEAHGVPVTFSDSLVLALCLHKGLTKRVARDAGVPTADFRVLENAGAPIDLPFPLFVKPVAEGTGKGVGPGSLCRSPTELAAAAGRLIARFGQPVLVERFLPGREFTVGILGSGDAATTIGVMEIDSDATYGFATKKNYAAVRYRLAEDAQGRRAAEVALAAWRALGCRDAGRVDLRSDADGQPMFLEVNPLAGLHPVDSDLVILARLAGHDHGWLIDRIMAEAAARSGLAW